MDPKQLYIDQRLVGICSYCGGPADSRDHVPSKILLDEPYPLNLPVAESCATCNLNFSASEQYFACLLECVKHGTTEPNENFRPKIAATLKARPSLAARLESAKYISETGSIIWQPEENRIRDVVLKLARGHLGYELGIQRNDEPERFQAIPFLVMSEEERRSFFEINQSAIYPEIGSRSFINAMKGRSTAYEAWCVVQESTYEYAVGQGAGDWVKIFIHQYLACHIAWN